MHFYINYAIKYIKVVFVVVLFFLKLQFILFYLAVAGTMRS